MRCSEPVLLVVAKGHATANAGLPGCALLQPNLSDESLAFLALVTFLVAFVGELVFSKTDFLALLSSFFKLVPFFTGDELSFVFGLFLAFLAFNDFSSSEESSLSAFLDFGDPFWPCLDLISSLEMESRFFTAAGCFLAFSF